MTWNQGTVAGDGKSEVSQKAGACDNIVMCFLRHHARYCCIGDVHTHNSDFLFY